MADKIILERYLKSNWAYPFFTALFLGLYCLGILIVRLALGQFDPPSLLAVGLALLPGLLHYAAALVFAQALRKMVGLLNSHLTCPDILYRGGADQ